ncbi:MAG: hypothetical protein MZU84_08635 [Sphingobacterium sp.]|nr:hypothetical protein [Sphingobacterium sp.]
MNDASYRTVIEEVLGLSPDKDALIVDTRFNGGGNLHDTLSDFLSGKKVFDIVPRGQLVGVEPMQQVDQAVHRRDGRKQLLRRPPLPRRIQGPGPRADAGHAGARHGDVRLVGIADRSHPALRHPPGRLADAGREALREQPARARHPGQERSGRHVGRPRPADRGRGQGVAEEKVTRGPEPAGAAAAARSLTMVYARSASATTSKPSRLYRRRARLRTSTLSDILPKPRSRAAAQSRSRSAVPMPRPWRSGRTAIDSSGVASST